MFEEIENKLSDILKSNKALSRELEENQVNSEKDKNEIFLDVISILDVFTREEKVIADHSWNQSEDSQKAIKRLTNVKKKSALYWKNTVLRRFCLKTDSRMMTCVQLLIQNLHQNTKMVISFLSRRKVILEIVICYVVQR